MKKNLNISSEELLKIDYKHTYLLKKFTNAKTYPQIVMDNTHVGGYTDMMEILDGD